MVTWQAVFSHQCLLLAHRGWAQSQYQAWAGRKAMVAAVVGTSVPRGSLVLAACSFPQLCGGIPPAFPSLQATLRPLAVPVSADSGGPSLSHCINTRFPQLPLGQQGLTGLVTGSQSPPLRALGAQETLGRQSLL